MLPITKNISIPDAELSETFILASGPGGQHVNKAATAVQLRFDVQGSSVLEQDAKSRLLDLAGSRTTKKGEVIITASTHRSRKRNRASARKRLASLVRTAMKKPKKRRKRKPGRAFHRKRLQEKKKQSEKKKLRQKPEL